MRNRWIAAGLAFFLGTWGIHKFYLGKNVSGFLYLIFFWTSIPWILGLIDGARLLAMSEQDFAIKFKALPQSSQDVTGPGERLDVALLKVCCQKSEGATIAECVMATGAAPQQVKEALLQLCKQDLLTIDNRSSDHAVVYKML
jgi:TM2 domain-containing membrane protein YozV